MAKTLVCTQCGHVGIPTQSTRGNGLIELVLWLTFIVPGIIYSIWRRSSPPQTCPKCKAQALIPVDSPRAKKILEESGQNQEEYLEVARKEDQKEKRQDLSRKIVWGALFAIVIIVIIFAQLSSS